MDYNRNGALSIRTRGFNSAALELNDHKCALCCLELPEPVVQTTCGHRFCRDSIVRRNDPRCPIDNEPLIETEQAIGDQRGDAGPSTEESHETTHIQQLPIPVQEQHPNLQPSFCSPGTSGIFHHFGEERAARSWYQLGLHQLPCQREDDNQASGWSRRFAGIRQGGSQATRREVCYVSNRLNTPVEEEGPDYGYDCGSGLQNRTTPILQKEHVTEHYCGTQELQQLSNEILRRLRLFDEAIMSQIEARICRGTYQWKIKHFQQCRQDAIAGAIVAQFSPAIYTSPDGYRFCIIMYPNGVNSGIGTHVAVFVHMMQGECDNRLSWPFTGVITLSILDQSAAKDPKDITQMLVTSPRLLAFRKPTAICSEIGCGFELFAPIEQICAEPFVQNNTMLVKIQIQSNLS